MGTVSNWTMACAVTVAGCSGHVDNVCSVGNTAIAGLGGAGGTTPSSMATGGTAKASVAGTSAISGNTGLGGSGLLLSNPFDNTLDGFTFSKVAAPAPDVNLVTPGDAGLSSLPPSLDWSGSVDFNGASATKGSMKITATFSDWGQQIEVEQWAPAVDINGNPIDLSNTICHAKVLLVRGLYPMAQLPSPCTPDECGPGGCVLYLKTGSGFDWGQGTWQNLITYGDWQDLTLDISNPDPQGRSATCDPNDPIQLGILFFSGSGLGTGDYGAPQPTAIYIDDVTLEKKP